MSYTVIPGASADEGLFAMNAHDVEVRFHEFAAHQGAVIDQLSTPEAIALMAAFYSEVRADDCDLNQSSDMLLFQWGAYDLDEGRYFSYDITRQLIPVPTSEDEEPDSFIGQLSLTLTFPSSTVLEETAQGNRWCGHPRELTDFLTFIHNCPATVAVQRNVPVAITLTYGNYE